MPLDGFDRFCQQHEQGLTEVAGRFADYQPLPGVDRARLRSWLDQFSPEHWGLALKLAGAIHYYSIQGINALMRELHGLINQQIDSEGVPRNRVYYVPFGSSEESGAGILRSFRNVNRLHRAQKRFVETRDIPKILLNDDDPVVFFLDDFVGTGNQVSNAWRQTISEIVPEHLRLYLAVVACTAQGAERIEASTPLRVIAVHSIGPRHQLMAAENTTLSEQEKHTIRSYCEKVGNQPLGFGDKGLLVSFAYGTPNNTISVIRGSKGQHPWAGLLPPWGDL